MMMIISQAGKVPAIITGTFGMYATQETGLQEASGPHSVLDPKVSTQVLLAEIERQGCSWSAYSSKFLNPPL